MELLADTEFAVHENELAVGELRAASEIWVTSSGRELVAITSLDGVPVGDGQPGPVFSQVRALYEAYRDSC